MPIQINLKEIFPSDPQEVFADKINFNYNKLIELGIGEPGKIGKTGKEGSAGPVGPDGITGERGNFWYTGEGDPNLITFENLKEGDLYLDTTSNSTWSYSEITSSWTKEIDLGLIVEDLVVQQGVSFIRGIGESSPLDSRFIVFPNRGNNNTDLIADTTPGNNSNNDILFLNNFNESFSEIDNFPADTDGIFNSIQSIFVDHTTFPIGRYHLEIGTLYNDTRVSPSVKKLTELKHNFKIRFIKDDISSTATYPDSNHFVNISRISMSKLETNPLTEITENGLFEFVTPSYDNEGASEVKTEATFRLGGIRALGEYSLTDATSGIYFQDATDAFTMGVTLDYPTSLQNTAAFDDTLVEDVIYIGKAGSPDSFLLDSTFKVRGDFYVRDVTRLGSGLYVQNFMNVSGSSTIFGVLKVINTIECEDQLTINSSGSPAVIKNDFADGIEIQNDTFITGDFNVDSGLFLIDSGTDVITTTVSRLQSTRSTMTELRRFFQPRKILIVSSFGGSGGGSGGGTVNGTADDKVLYFGTQNTFNLSPSVGGVQILVRDNYEIIGDQCQSGNVLEFINTTGFNKVVRFDASVSGSPRFFNKNGTSAGTSINVSTTQRYLKILCLGTTGIGGIGDPQISWQILDQN